jgi:hypothetical protein
MSDHKIAINKIVSNLRRDARCIPTFLRTGFAISTKTGEAANTMTEDEWGEFYNVLSDRLKCDYPDYYERIFLGA